MKTTPTTGGTPMNRREFIIRVGTALIAVPVALSLESCGNDNGDTPAPPGFDVNSTVDLAHSHSVRILTSDLTNPPASGVVYTSSVSDGHTHTIALTQQQLTDINNGVSVPVVSSVTNAHTHGWTIQKP
jgi:hypothetical protein